MRITRWDEVLPQAQTDAYVKDLAYLFADRISDQCLRNTIRSFLDRDAILDLCKHKPDYENLSVSDSAALVQVLAFYRKRRDLELGVDREEVAYAKFVGSERHCEVTNATFRKWAAGDFMFPRRVERLLFSAQRKIANLLGDVPDFASLRLRFGPGATTQTKRRDASPRYKLGERFACSEELAGTVSDCLSELPSWVPFGDSDRVTVPVEIHPGQLHFVPKDAFTDRSIVVEPSLNSFYQLGIGDYIADRLRTRGIDIRDQTRNQNLAQVASLYGELATLDLSSASDLIACELVAHLLPIDWFLFLSRFRSGTVEYKGASLKLQKFSSMGNGFTFPLETLIFWALAQSAIEETSVGQAAVYGDDIIVPVTTVPLLIATLTSCGFLVNNEKSHWSGPFRESCGKDYHSGILIRPVFLKTGLSGESVFILHNFFVRVGDTEAALVARSFLDPSILLFGPDGYGDGHLLRLPDENSWEDFSPHKRDRQWAGYTFDTFAWKGRKNYRPSPGDYVFPAYSIYLREGFLSPFDERVFDLLVRYGIRAFPGPSRQLAVDLLVRCNALRDTDDYPVRKGRDAWGVTTPGVSGYKRIKIYTLTI